MAGDIGTTGRVTVSTGTAVDALVMPADLGAAVAHALVAALQPAAVITTGMQRWATVLTAPRPQGIRLSADLDAARVRLLPAGTPVSLPIPGNPDQVERWVVPPRRGAGLPPHPVVAALARRAAASSSRSPVATCTSTESDR